MDHSLTGGADAVIVSHESVSLLEVDAIDIDYDDKYLYAACSDQHIRVFSKSSWQLVVELSVTDSIPLAIDVDEEQVYATCEKRVYVWKKESWGMIGWFDLSYQAVTSLLQGDFFFIGAKEGRLVSIQKESHDTSSWQLHKSDLSSIWSDDRIICTSTKKEEPRVWLKESDSAPSELARLDKKGKGGVLTGNSEFVFVGSPSGEIAVYERTEWNLSKTLEPKISSAVSSMWASNNYLIVAHSSGHLAVWDTKRGDEVGNIELDVNKIVYLTADHDLVYVATSAGIFILQLKVSGKPLDVCSEGPLVWQESLLKTSPYDVLEESLKLERSGSQKYQDGLYHEAIIEYENAMQLIIDNTHALQEVPDERQLLINELDTRLGKALLKAKIQEVQALHFDIKQLSEELQERKQTEMNPEDVDRYWASAGRVIKESRVLADAQSDDMLSLQLTHEIDILDSILIDAMTLYDVFRETINQAIALTRQISNEWHKMERKRSSLVDRKDFLETSIRRITSALDAAEPEGEVRTILRYALDGYKKIFEQIDWIISSSESESEQVLSNRDEALETIDTLLVIIPKRRDALGVITDSKEHEKERHRLITAIQQALESAKTFKLTKSIQALENELSLLEGENTQ
ncbi:MAG: WD40 repeat domain-containing protein [Candidatus Thorarchaeota archaeon]|nr:MAG: WD40 repeat domain-containing protein [Candidatus Thorarchaeota archaeon]